MGLLIVVDALHALMAANAPEINFALVEVGAVS